MVNNRYAKAYKEVTEILKHVPEEDVKKIPKAKIEFYTKNMDKKYNYELDMTKDFEQQKMLDETKAILANIYTDYWATPYQRERIQAKEQYDLNILEEQKRKKYNPDDVFKKRETKNIVQTNLPIEVKKENFFSKLINFIKGLFKKSNT